MSDVRRKPWATMRVLGLTGFLEDRVNVEDQRADVVLLLSQNDRALVALRTWRKRFDLDTLDTIVTGEYAYPMISRGLLVGALVCGPKTDGDSYAPDESNAISELAHGVGTALHLLEDRRQDDSHLVLERLDRLNLRIDQIMEERSNGEPRRGGPGQGGVSLHTCRLPGSAT